MPGTWCILILANFTICSGLQQTIDFVFDPLFADKVCDVQYLEFETTAGSILSCVLVCKTAYIAGCNSVIYNAATKLCYGLTSAFPCATWSDVIGARFYRPTQLPTTTTTTTTTTTPTTTILGCMTSEALLPGVPDSQFSETSIWDQESYAFNGRLDSATCWSVKQDNVDEYAQVDFLSNVIITGVITRGDPTTQEWVTTYKVLVSTDCSAFSAVKYATGSEDLDISTSGQKFLPGDEAEPRHNSGQFLIPWIFPGNSDQNTPVTNDLDTPVVARCVRIDPQTVHEWQSIRFEFLGCIP